MKKEIKKTIKACSFAFGLLFLWHGASQFAQAADENTEAQILPKAPVMMQDGTDNEAVTGCYDSSFSLSIKAENGLKVYYTLDGSDPAKETNKARREYTGAVTITDRKTDENFIAAVDPARFDNAASDVFSFSDNSGISLFSLYGAPEKENADKASVVRAVSYDPESDLYSEVTTNTYFIGEMTSHISGIAESAKAAGIPLAILSISTDFDNLFDEETGIYVRGKMFWDELAKWSAEENWLDNIEKNFPANFLQRGKDWERPAHIDYLESDGMTTEVKLQQDCGIRIQGNYSRRDLQKSFRLVARKEYGKKNFNYPFFGEDAKDYEGNVLGKHKKLIVHSGGNDAFAAKYHSTYWQTLFSGLNCDIQHSRACVVYVDGEYHGLYILQEDLGADYAEKHHGLDKDAYGIVSYKGDHERNPDTGYEIDDGEDYLPDGEDKTYFMKDLMNFFDTHKSCISQKDYDALAKLADPDSCMDYFASEIWINNKWDWPGKNWYMWRTTRTPENADSSNPYADGRWRFTLCDMDFGGIGGKSEAGDNTLTKEKDLLNPGYTDKVGAGVVIVKTFAYFMSNEGFRNRFVSRLEEIAEDIAGEAKASALLTKFAETYGPLYEQFFKRYHSRIIDRKNAVTVDQDSGIPRANYTDNSELSLKREINSAKGAKNSLLGFIQKRGSVLPVLKETIEAKAATYQNIDPEGYAQMLEEKKETSETDSEKSSTKTATKLKLTAKVMSGKKKLVISTTKKAVLTIKFSKKVSFKSGKKVKKIKKLTIKASKTGTGKVSLTFQKKLPKKLKITITAQKGKKKKTVKVTVK